MWSHWFNNKGQVKANSRATAESAEMVWAGADGGQRHTRAEKGTFRLRTTRADTSDLSHAQVSLLATDDALSAVAISPNTYIRAFRCSDRNWSNICCNLPLILLLLLLQTLILLFGRPFWSQIVASESSDDSAKNSFPSLFITLLRQIATAGPSTVENVYNSIISPQLN